MLFSLLGGAAVVASQSLLSQKCVDDSDGSSCKCDKEGEKRVEFNDEDFVST